MILISGEYPIILHTISEPLTYFRRKSIHADEQHLIKSNPITLKTKLQY